MSHEHAAAGEHKPHVLPVRIYAAVWVGLLILTVITVRVSYYDFGFLNLLIAMLVATAKASLVVLFFMHLKYDEPFNKIVFMGCLAFLAVFFVLTLADTMERGKVDPLEAKEIVPVPARPELWDETRRGAAHGEHGTEAGETPAPGHGTEAGEAPADGHGTEADDAPPEPGLPEPSDDAGGH